jgi:hypothetical protein
VRPRIGAGSFAVFGGATAAYHQEMRGFGWWSAGNRAYSRLLARAERNWIAYVAVGVAPGLCGVLLAQLLLPLVGIHPQLESVIAFIAVWTIVTAVITTHRLRARRHLES